MWASTQWEWRKNKIVLHIHSHWPYHQKTTNKTKQNGKEFSLHVFLSTIEFNGSFHLPQSGIEDSVSTFTLPVHGLVVRSVISSWTNCRLNGGVPLHPTSHLGDCRHLNCLTWATRTASPLTAWRPWTYVRSHKRLLFISQLQYQKKMEHSF